MLQKKYVILLIFLNFLSYDVNLYSKWSIQMKLTNTNVLKSSTQKKNMWLMKQMVKNLHDGPKTLAIYRQFQSVVSNRQEKDRWTGSGT